MPDMTEESEGWYGWERGNEEESSRKLGQRESKDAFKMNKIEKQKYDGETRLFT